MHSFVKNSSAASASGAVPSLQSTNMSNSETGLPSNLKMGMEALSGLSLNHINVHYNSKKPATVQAHAYTQGSNIHVGSGQEKHLSHELGHVVQQMQGRVKPTKKVNGFDVNDDPSLESEATRMGEKALSVSARQLSSPFGGAIHNDESGGNTVQRITQDEAENEENINKPVKIVKGMGASAGFTGRIVRYDNEQNQVIVAVSLPDGGPPFEAPYDLDGLEFISEEVEQEVVAAQQSRFETGELAENPITNIDRLMEVMNTVAGDGWMISGSRALNLWADFLGVARRRDPHDADILVDEDRFTDIRRELDNAFSTDSNRSNNPQYGGGRWQIDLAAANNQFGSLDERVILPSGCPVLSLEALKRSKEADKKKRMAVENDPKLPNIEIDLAFIDELIAANERRIAKEREEAEAAKKKADDEKKG